MRNHFNEKGQLCMIFSLTGMFMQSMSTNFSLRNAYFLIHLMKNKVVRWGPGWNVTENEREASDVFRRSPAFPVHHSLCLTFSQLTCRLYKTGVLKSDDGDGWREKEKGKLDLKLVFLVDRGGSCKHQKRCRVFNKLKTKYGSNEWFS